ncbi:MAG: hypothetical protein F6K50_36220 [Moorea sp. SIO3I7]|uniref:hypothetical protein n=2 Tax=Moorena TaxID=1155738 RepID=UPI0013C68F04|nr:MULTISPECIES: hypothetical protein [unclassified Moorena]NEO00692.1 hypothetical protein [Moorena sp. SIO3I7]NEO45672.1 hypothetical protein [Moorena sp. SIO4A3]NEO63354.1 hypothetical protein [Moorena sp. SIO4G2]NEO14021.1 hypothetical protein [Moorena sp. SIO3E8]NEQ00446.1 hypothetical protein [Moorena sp. SIO3F7]
MKKQLFYLIKITSTSLITCALGLEIWYIYLQLTHSSLPSNLYYVLWLGSIALISHFIEGVIAAFKADSCDKNPITYGIYTFFVGFVGLWELLNPSSESSSYK